MVFAFKYTCTNTASAKWEIKDLSINKCITAYYIVGKATEGGTVTGGGLYIKNADVTLTAIPNEGYEFVQWTDGNTDNPRIFTATGEGLYVAEFAALVPHYTLTLLVNDADAGTVEGAGEYEDSTKVVIKAIPNEYYEFVRWSDGSTQNPRRITITSDTTLTAYFVDLLAEEVNNVNDMTVVPSDDNATFTWPTTSGATTYTLTISKDGVVFCTLIFNANGQLTGIAFAPARDGSRYASTVGGGLQFTVTGLDEASAYTYIMEAKDADNQTVAAYSGVFATTGYEGEMPEVPVIDGVESLTQSREDANGVRYNVLGQPVGEDYKGIVIVNGRKYLVR